MNFPTGAPDLDRVVEIEYRKHGGDWKRGTGYLVAPRTVLTAGHVVREALTNPEQVRVRAASRTGSEDWAAVTKVVLAASAQVDVAVLVLDAEWAAASPEPIGLVDIAAPVPFHACGFPHASRADETPGSEAVRGVETARGTMQPAAREPLLLLDVRSATPAPRSPTSDGRPRSGWAGLSGAALFGPDHLFVGVVVNTNVKYAGVRLHAVPVERVLSDTSLAPHLPTSWREREPQRVGHHITLRVGTHHRIRLRPPHQASWRAGQFRGSPTTLLAAGSEIVPYIAREQAQKWLTDWCAGDSPVSYAIISGEGGAGKSRLAAELCSRMAGEGWVSGIAEAIPEARGGHDDVAASELGNPLLLVVDYADHRQSYVADLLNGAGTAGSRKVRILAIVRDSTAFSRRLATELGSEDAESAARRSLSLTEASLSPAEREVHYRSARTHFAAALGLGDRPDPEPTRVPQIVGHLSTPLLVHARALLDLLEAEQEGEQTIGDGTATSMDPERVFLSLLDREDRRFWESSFGDLLKSGRARRTLFAVSTLVGADDESEAVRAVGGAGPLRDWSDDRRRELVERIQDVYDGRYLPAVEPDLLGEQLIAEMLLEEHALLRVFECAGSVGQRSRALEVLLRMCGSPVGLVGQRARLALGSVIRQQIGELVDQAALTAGPNARTVSHDALQLPSRLASGLDQVEFVWTPAEAVAAIGRLPKGSRFQSLTSALFESASRSADASGDYPQAAALKVKSATALTAAGRLEAAQAPLEQAQVYLAMAPTHVSDQNLARVLSAGSIVSTSLNQTGVALSDALRAVEIVEGLPAGADGKDALLLESRYSLALAYAAAARYPEAAETAGLAYAHLRSADSETSVRVCGLQAQMLIAGGDFERAIAVLADGAEQIDRVGSSADDANLARLLITRAAYLAIVGRFDEARQNALRAERITEALALSEDEAMLLLLAQVKVASATVASLADDNDLAEVLAHEGSDGLYALYRVSPDVYGPTYALSEASFARTLTVNGHVEEARQAAHRGLDAARRGFPDRPAPYLIALAETSIALANAYVHDDDWTQAIGVIEEAYSRVRRLDRTVVADADLMCAYLLRCLTDIEIAGGNPEARVSTAGRAVDAYAILARESDFPGYLLPLIGARLLQVVALGQVDRDAEAGSAAEQALVDAEHLIELAPNDQSRRILALARYVVADARAFHGDSDAALSLLQKALDEHVLDHETSGDRADREALRQAIQEIESPADRSGDDSAPPSGFADLTRGRHRVVLGRWRDSEIAARAFRPVLVFGPQRSRKTTSLVVPTLLEWDGPALVTSVRSDVAMATIAHRARSGRTWVFEPTGELFVGGSAITSWNPIEGCEDFEQAVAMAYALTESAHSKAAAMTNDRFWYSQATLLIQPLLHAAALSRMSMEAISRWIRTEARAEVQARLLLSDSQEARDIFRAFSTMAEVTRSGVYATARDVLRVYESSAVRAASRSGFSIPEFFSGANTLYLCAPPEEQERLSPIFTALVRNVVNEAYRRQGGDLNLLLLLDEAGNIAPVENLDTIATTAAGTRIQLVTVFHDFSQLTEAYGESKAQSIVNNHSALLVLPGNRDPLTMDLVDRILADEAAGLRRRRSIRQLKPGTALCVYDHLPVEDIVLRSSTHDPQFQALTRPSQLEDGDDPTGGLLIERR